MSQRGELQPPDSVVTCDLGDGLTVGGDHVRGRLPSHRVGSITAVDDVTLVAAAQDDGVVTVAACDDVPAGACCDVVGALSALDDVVAVAARNGVVPAVAVDGVVPAETVDRVCVISADDDIVAGITVNSGGCGDSGRSEEQHDTGRADDDASAHTSTQHL